MRILVTESENFSQEAIDKLQKHFEVTFENLNSEDELLAIIENFDVLFIRLRFRISEKILKKATRLQYILTATTGLDHIDLNYFEKLGGKVVSLRGEVAFLESIPSTAEHTWALLLALVKKIPFSFADVMEGNWNRDEFKGNNLKGKKLGVLGLGRVGKQLATFAEAFQMDLSYYDINSIESKYRKMETPQALFSWADIVSINIPYTLENENFVNYNLLKHCKKETFLINTSRGNVWDEIAVARLLEDGKIKGVGTDVLRNEFDKDSIVANPLVVLANKKHNIIITPHIAGASYESMEITENFIVDKFIATLKKIENE